MDKEHISAVLEKTEAALARGDGLRGTGFWKAVSAVKRDPDLITRYATRAGEIDRRAFERAVSLKIPAGRGIAALAAGTAGGIALVLAAGSFDHRLLRTSVFAAGFLAILVFSHSLTHWLVGRMTGMRFTYCFLGGPKPPRPGVKVDYATYLTASPRQRAVMHASGAVVTKVVPFALYPLAVSIRVYPWASWGLLGIGIAQILTDVLLSTKNSDWMKVRRELST